MGDHENEIPEMYSPLHEVGDVDSTPVYDTSHFGYDPSFLGHRYWFPGKETHHEPTSTSHVHYGMHDIPAHDSAHHAES